MGRWAPTACTVLLVSGAVFLAAAPFVWNAVAGSANVAPRKPNRLINETSPYLLQHAHNPVNWYPWGKEALERAKKEDKPIFLSIGYSTCYWCHVMEHESFETEDVAKVLNAHFIAIKVDREERPDLDEQYMLATQLLTGRGGWPNSIWLTPDGRPWMAGTYFPRERLIAVLTELNRMWTTRRAEVLKQADRLAQAIRQSGSGRNVQSGPIGQPLVDRAVAGLRQSFDTVSGGFGGSPKFPPHGGLRLLIHECRRRGDKDLLKMIARTLDAMASGGVHDHVGGGFHRYATDSTWFLPHFEKMLYDNAQLMRTYTDGYLLTGNEDYRDVVARIFRWIERSMTDPGGAFYSAIDAGDVGKEGDFYVWRYEEVLGVLGKTDGERFGEVYGLRRGGNFREEATGHRPGANILHLGRSVDQFAKDKGLDADRLQADLGVMREKLLAVRNQRVQPRKDDKILTSWNGLMIGSLAYAGRQMKEPQYTEAAAKAAEFILNNMMSKDARLLRSYRADQAKLPGYLDDYAFLAEGLLELHEATGQRRWLDQARRLADAMLASFQDEENGGFFFTSAQHEDLLLRSKNLMGGGNIPSGNGVVAQVLLRLGRAGRAPRYSKAAQSALESLAGVMWQSPAAVDSLVLAAAMSLEHAAMARTAPAGSDVQQTYGPLTVGLVASRLKVRPGQAFHVAISLDIAKGWHLYGSNPELEFLVPATVSLKPHSAVTAGHVVAPKGRTLQDPVLQKAVTVYEGRVWFVIPLGVGKNTAAGPTTLEFLLRTQACDDRQCLAPQTATVQLPVVIDPDAPAGDPRHRSVFDLPDVRALAD